LNNACNISPYRYTLMAAAVEVPEHKLFETRPSSLRWVRSRARLAVMPCRPHPISGDDVRKQLVGLRTRPSGWTYASCMDDAFREAHSRRTGTETLCRTSAQESVSIALLRRPNRTRGSRVLYLSRRTRADSQIPMLQMVVTKPHDWTYIHDDLRWRLVDDAG